MECYNQEIFANRLGLLMEENGDTIMSLAEYLGLSKATISKYRAGLMSPKLTAMQKIAEKYGVNPLWLMGSEAEEKYTNYNDWEPFTKYVINYLKEKNITDPKEAEKLFKKLLEIYDVMGK